MEDHAGVVDTDNSITSDPGTSSARASVIRQVLKDNLGNKYHNNSKSSYFVDTEIRDGDNNKEVVIENIDGDSNVAGNGENIALVDDGGDDIPWPGAKTKKYRTKKRLREEKTAELSRKKNIYSLAVADMKSGKYSSYRKCCKDYGIASSALS